MGIKRQLYVLASLTAVFVGSLPSTGVAQETRLAGTLENNGSFLAIVEQDGFQWLIGSGEPIGDCRVGEIQASSIQLQCRDGMVELPLRSLTDREPPGQLTEEASYIAIQKDILDNLISDRQKLADQLDLAPEVDEQGVVSGWRVVSVREHSDVEALGLRPGDLITAVNHVHVADSVFMDALRSVPEQGLINLSLRRQKKTIELIYSMN